MKCLIADRIKVIEKNKPMQVARGRRAESFPILNKMFRILHLKKDLMEARKPTASKRFQEE